MLVAVLWATGCERASVPQMTAEQALAEIGHLLDGEAKQLVTAHLRRRVAEITRALARIAEGNDDAANEARAALRELRELTR